jgi:type VI secretion system protein ImpK
VHVGKADSHDLADLLEVFYLCLLLGFSGKYRVGNRGELDQIMNVTRDKIRRIRGPFGQLSPAWMLPPGSARSMVDPWVKKLMIIAISSAGAMLLFFILYTIILHIGVSDVRALAPQTIS